MYVPSGVVDLREIAAPATPASGLVRIYGKADGLVYSKDDAGAERLLSFASFPVQFHYGGLLGVSTGAFQMRMPYACTLEAIEATVGTAPTGAEILLDVNKGSAGGAKTTLFTTQTRRPTIAISGFSATMTALPDVLDFAAGDCMTVDIDRVGSTIAGSNLAFWAWMRRTA